ncbi:uncharacterized protein EKO05_0004727 [Ascochyta rabiei]|uniref:Uncharacterized protein n=1 Tax=Didymella rabiei TaxID=5454 RepID=A0A163KGI2_DIDRA|nr:uncharacterized protein EKO05_0004727 [Ascochyta rabiei]KZM26982.1 hypothetical protein ST47_g1911 [Ascochyta rabiei]UPX14238.1 hypothetical protein EKO05_0004727 [Ascochyta rabiei]
MEPAAAGILYAAENILQGAAALVKGITYPTLPIKTNLTRITSVPLPRSQHTVSVVKGRAYIFGGETAPGKLADNDMHIIILPSSGVLDADYTSKPAQAANGLDDVPGPRKGHTAVVIGDSIYVFGGRGEVDSEENGRVWAYHTVSSTWSYLDPAPGTSAPSQRVGHTSASSDFPAAKSITYQERAPQQPVDPSKNVPEPPVDDTWGTIFIVGGRNVSSGQLANDALAFDLRTRSWSNIPSPPGQPREGASLSLAGSRLYRFGGKGVETFASGALEYLDVAPVFNHAEGGTTPLTSGWAWQEVSHADSKDLSVPQARSNAGLVEVTTGQGRHYLVAIGGEGEDARHLDDIWTFQLPPEYATAAATKDAIRSTLKRDTHEATWAEVLYNYVDTKGEEEKEIPGEPKRGLGERGQFGIAKGTEVDGATCVVWGGVDSGGNVLSDGWMVTVDR